MYTCIIIRVNVFILIHFLYIRIRVLDMTKTSMHTHRIAFRVWLGHCIQFFWKARPYYIFQSRWIHVGRLVSFKVASADLPTVLEDDRIASFSYFSKFRAQLTQRIPYKRRYSLDRPIASLWVVFSKATRPGGAFSKLQRSTVTTSVQTVQSGRLPIVYKFCFQDDNSVL